MFSQEVGGFDITQVFADELFSNVMVPQYGEDLSFIATARILISPRLHEGESFNVRYFYPEHISKDSLNEVVEQNGRINLFIFTSEKMDKEQMNEIESPDGFYLAEDLCLFIGKSFPTRVFINEDEKKAIVVVDRMSLKKWHYVQAFLPRLAPWVFKEEKINEDEKALLRALTSAHSASYKEIVGKLEKPYDFRTAKIKYYTATFEKKEDERRIESIRKKRMDLNIQIQSYISRLSDFYKNVNELNLNEYALQHRVDSKKSGELMDYFLKNKSVEFVSASESSVRFMVKTHYVNYDVDFFENAIDYDGSTFYDVAGCSGNCFWTECRVKKFMKAIFEDSVFEIRMCSAFNLDFSDMRVEGLEEYDFPDDYETYVPNMHIQNHACLGSNEPIILEAMRQYNYIGSIEACIAAAGSHNMEEGITFSPLLKEIYAEDARAFIERVSDGALMTPMEACEWLENE